MGSHYGLSPGITGSRDSREPDLCCFVMGWAEDQHSLGFSSWTAAPLVPAEAERVAGRVGVDPPVHPSGQRGGAELQHRRLGVVDRGVLIASGIGSNHTPDREERRIPRTGSDLWLHCSRRPGM